MSPGLLEDVTEYRKAIQLECARLAVKRATEEELLELRSCCERFEKELDRYYTLTDPEKARESFIATVDIGLDFHTQLFKMAHNQLLGYSFSIAKGPIPPAYAAQRQQSSERPGQRPGQHLDQDLLGHLQGGGGPGL